MNFSSLIASATSTICFVTALIVPIDGGSERWRGHGGSASSLRVLPPETEAEYCQQQENVSWLHNSDLSKLLAPGKREAGGTDAGGGERLAGRLSPNRLLVLRRFSTSRAGKSEISVSQSED